MKIKVLSDLHFEKTTGLTTSWENIYDVSNCDVLCLAGDIGDPMSEMYWTFIDYAKEKAKYVLIVTGNHEYWGRSVAEVDAYIRLRCNGLSNVFFLQKEPFFYGGYVFLGCTLWSELPEVMYKHFDMIKDPNVSLINDCKHPDVFNRWHKEHLEWLKNAIDEAQKRELKPIVITHFAPMFNVCHRAKYRNEISQHSFSTDLRYLFDKVPFWVFGHTHCDTKQHKFKIKDYKTLFVSNQQGYPFAVRNEFDNNFMFDTKNVGIDYRSYPVHFIDFKQTL